MRARWRLLGVLATLVLVLPAGSCSGGPSTPSGLIRIATGSPAGVYYLYGQAIASLITQQWPGAEARVLTTTASAENLQLLVVGKADVGFSQADIAASGGLPESLVALARLYDDYVHVVVPARAPVRTIADLRGRWVSMGPSGSGTEITATRLLTVGGLSPVTDVRPVHLDLEASVTALRQGSIDAFFYSGGLPVDAIAALARDIPIRLLDLGAYVGQLRRQFGEHYSERVIPRSTYGTPPVATIGLANYLVVRQDMPEDLAYALTRLIFDGRDALARAHPTGARLNIRSAVDTYPLALHPGAVRFYRERKI
jgi:TRAP transporter TAXI family solute receptor